VCQLVDIMYRLKDYTLVKPQLALKHFLSIDYVYCLLHLVPLGYRVSVGVQID